MAALKRPATWLTLVLIVSLAFNAGVGVNYGRKAYSDYCRHRDRERGERPPRPSGWDEIYAKLNLTPEQMAVAKEKRDALFTDMRAQRSELAKETSKLNDLMLASDASPEAISAQLDAVMAVRRAMQQRIIDHYASIRAVLTPEQQQQYADLLRERLTRSARHGWGEGDRFPPGERRGPGAGNGERRGRDREDRPPPGGGQ